MINSAPNRKKGGRLIATALSAMIMVLTFPEGHYSAAKVFVKSPSPQNEICALLCDDVEDSNDSSTCVHFFQSGDVIPCKFLLVCFFYKNCTKENFFSVGAKVYLLHGQLLI